MLAIGTCGIGENRRGTAIVPQWRCVTKEKLLGLQCLDIVGEIGHPLLDLAFMPLTQRAKELTPNRHFLGAMRRESSIAAQDRRNFHGWELSSVVLA